MQQQRKLTNDKVKINPFPNETFLAIPNSKSLQTTMLNLAKIAENSWNG